MAAWPGTLPSSLHIGVEVEDAEGAIETQMDAGPPKKRRAFSGTVRMLRGSMLLTGTQVSTLDTFYRTTTAEGADTFTGFRDPVTGTSTRVAQFMQAPKYRGVRGTDAGASGRLWEAQLEIRLHPA